MTSGRKPRRSQGGRVIRFIEGHCVHPDGEWIGQTLKVHPWWRARILELFEVNPVSCPLCGEISSFRPILGGAQLQEAAGEIRAHAAVIGGMSEVPGADPRMADGEAPEAYICAVCEKIVEQIPPDERRYREALIGIAKKNAKTTMAAALGLYLLLADGDPSSLVISAACSEEQGSNLLYGAAKTMCELSPPLAELTEPYQKEILVPSLPRARMRNVASKAGSNDGLNIKALICDELHEWKGQRGRDLYNVLSNGVGARRDPMVLSISTAGHDQDSICYEKYTYGKRVAAGEINDPSFYFFWLEPPDECDHRDPKIWALANPLLDVSVRSTYLADQCRKKPESVFRRYNLDQWVAGETIWIPFGAWDACQSSIDLDPALPLHVGIDIARSIDSSALARCQRIDLRPLTCPLCEAVDVTFAPLDDGNGGRCSACGDLVLSPPPEFRLVLRVTIWENPYLEPDPLYESWTMNNHLVIEACRELFVQFPVPATMIDDVIMPGPMFAYDPWRFRSEADQLQGEGLAMVEYPQNDTRMVPASQGFYEAIMKQIVAHDGDPAFKRQVQAATADQRDRGWRISKPKGSRKKIDAAVAAAIAAYNAANTKPPAPRRSVYETRGIRTIG